MNAAARSFIPQANPHAAYVEHKAEIDAALVMALERGQYILGPEVAAFEREFATWLGGGYAVGVASGTDALELALRACGVGFGHFVGTVSHTAVATVAAIERAGATPVVVDIDPSTFTMAPSSLETALREYGARVKAIVPVHLYGHPADMAAILELAQSHGLRVIEDASQAHGARWHGQRVGRLGDIAAFSLYPTKNLGALGDGGIVATNNIELAERVRQLREYGWRQRYVSDVAGVNSRLDEVQAAILRVKLRYLDADNARRQAIAAAYDKGLQVTTLRRPSVAPGADSVFHQYVIRCTARDRCMAFLRERGVGTSIHYPLAVHQQPAYVGSLLRVGRLAATEAAAAEVLSLPMFPQLSPEAVDRVIAALSEWR